MAVKRQNACKTHVQRKVRMCAIPELYLCKVGMLILSADSGIVPDNSRIAQWVFYRLLLGPESVGQSWDDIWYKIRLISQCRKQLDKVRIWPTNNGKENGFGSLHMAKYRKRAFLLFNWNLILMR